eukprot:RCo038870
MLSRCSSAAEDFCSVLYCFQFHNYAVFGPYHFFPGNLRINTFFFQSFFSSQNHSFFTYQHSSGSALSLILLLFSFLAPFKKKKDRKSAVVGKMLDIGGRRI